MPTNNLSKYIIGIGVAAIAAFLIWYFSSIVFYLVVSAIFTIIGQPIVDLIAGFRVKSWNTPRWLAALITVVGIWAIVIAAFYFFIPIVLNKFQEFSNIDINQMIVMFQKPLDNFQHFLGELGINVSNFSIADNIVEETSKLLNINTLDSALTSTVTFIGNTVIAAFSITFISFFLLKEEKLLRDMSTACCPEKHEEHIRRAMDSITNLLRRYFTGLLIESTIIMVLNLVILICFGVSVKTSLFIGLTMGVLNVIPYIGPIIGTCIAIVTANLYPIPGASPLYMSLIVAGSAIFGNIIDNFVLQPVLYSKSVKAHPLEIFIVILMAGSIAGVLGMLLAIPAYNVIRVLLKEFFSNSSFVRRLTRNI